MSQMNPSQARVIDPILTEVARGYLSQAAAAANALFPIVPVGQRGGRIITFGPDDFKLVDTRRAPGTNTKRIQVAYGSDNFSLIDHSLEGQVPIELQEEAAAVPGIDLGSNAVRSVQNRMALEREYNAARLARDANKYAASNKKALSGTSRWSNPASDPFTDIMGAKEAVRGQIGTRPNVLTVAPKGLTALRTHTKVLDRLSTASDRPPASLEQLKRLFELDDIVEAAAVHHDGSGFKDVWGTDAVLAYTAPKSLQEAGSPSYGYTYRLTGYPTVEEAYFERNPKSWFYPVTDALQPVLAGASAGFLFQTVAD